MALLTRAGALIYRAGQGLVQATADCLTACCRPWYCCQGGGDVASICTQDLPCDPPTTLAGTYATEEECDQFCSGGGPEIRYCCWDDESHTTSSCSEFPCPEGLERGGPYNSASECQENCNMGACCEWYWCQPGECVPVESAWIRGESGVCQQVHRNPDGDPQWYSDGCRVRALYDESGENCSGDVVGYPHSECLLLADATCAQSSQAECQAAQGTWFENTPCDNAPCMGNCFGTGVPSDCDGLHPANYCDMNNGTGARCAPSLLSAIYMVTITGADLFYDSSGNPVDPEYQQILDEIDGRTFMLQYNSCSYKNIELNFSLPSGRGVYILVYALHQTTVLTGVAPNTTGIGPQRWCWTVSCLVTVSDPFVQSAGNSGPIPNSDCYEPTVAIRPACECEWPYHDCSHTGGGSLRQTLSGNVIDFSNATYTIAIP